METGTNDGKTRRLGDRETRMTGTTWTTGMTEMTEEDLGTEVLGEDLMGRCSLSLSKGVTNHAKYLVPELVEGEKKMKR